MKLRRLICLSLVACYIFFISFIVPEELLIWVTAVFYAGIWKFIGLKEAAGIWMLKLLKALPRLYGITLTDFDLAEAAKHADDFATLLGQSLNPNYTVSEHVPVPHFNTLWLIPMVFLFDWFIICMYRIMINKYSTLGVTP